MGPIIILIIAGVLLLFAELLLVPGIGVAGILGVAALGGSCFYAFHELGTYPGIIVTVINVCLVSGLIICVLRSKTWKKFELHTVIDSKAAPTSAVNPGEKGRAVTRLAPMGTARIGDKTVEVTSAEGLMDADTEIEVLRVENNKIYVKKFVN